jgi:hypothetical protein
MPTKEETTEEREKNSVQDTSVVNNNRIELLSPILEEHKHS